MRPETSTALTVERCADYEMARGFVVREWGDDAIVIAGRARHTADLSLYCARSPGRDPAGFAYYHMNGVVALLGAIVVSKAGQGAGSALFEAVLCEARALRMKKLRAITTNDNMEAMRFYQKQGMRFMALFAGGVDAYRAFRPGIIREGRHGIPCRDVLELEMDL